MTHSPARSGRAGASSPLRLLLALLLGLALVAAACGDDDDDTEAAGDTTTTAVPDEGGDAADDGGGAMDGASDPEAKPHTEMSPEELEVWQTDLNAVGCWAGPIDGELGPQTEAAIKSFQTAAGLTVDGLLGPITEGALQEAVAAGETVCTTTTGGADPADDGEGAMDGQSVATLTSDSYGKTFTVGSCSLNADVSNISLRGEADNITLAVDASEGSGTLSVDGGTEGDGITLNGTVNAVDIGDGGSFTVTGELGEPNNAGETFTLEGSCAGS